MSIMVDTGAWYAVCDKSDRNHAKAKEYYEKTAGKVELYTTDAILVETWTLLSARLGRLAAVTFWQTLRDAGIPVLTLDQSDLEAAWRILNTFTDQSFSFTDCTTFAVMERLHIDRVFTFDRHFLVYRYGPDRRRAFTCEPLT